MIRLAVLFAALFTALLAARMCHVDVLWAEETLPLAAAAQMRESKVLYRDVWFDKPPMLPAAYLLSGARDGWPLRLAGALYALSACMVAFWFARHQWDEAEARWAASLLAFFLIFETPASALPLAADLLMLTPHLAAVYLAAIGRPFWSGLAAGIAFSINSKALFVLAACVLWAPTGIPALVAGFTAPFLVIAGILYATGGWTAYYQQVWVWGGLYAADTFVSNPLANSVRRTANWLGFHAALAAPAALTLRLQPERWKWIGWAALSLAATALGWRFFPRYFFQLLPVVVLLGARGMVLLGRWRLAAVALLLIPAIRFGPRHVLLASGQSSDWADTAMDRDSRAAARIIRHRAQPGDTLFVWGYRPELFIYSGLPAGTRFLDCQPLTGVAADRHLFDSTPTLPAGWREQNRREIVSSKPTFVVEGLGLYNPALAITRYPELEEWMRAYTEIGRTPRTIVYIRTTESRSSSP